MGSQVDDFLHQKMDRKQFLAHVGAGALTVIGVTNLIKHLSDFNVSKPRQEAVGYGSSPYGGKKK